MCDADDSSVTGIVNRFEEMRLDGFKTDGRLLQYARRPDRSFWLGGVCLNPSYAAMHWLDERYELMSATPG